MKLIDKADLQFIDGMLIGADSQVLNLAELADEVNEIVDLADLIGFAKANATAIEAATAKKTVVKFERNIPAAPKFESGTPKPATPLKDAKEAEAHALAEEWLAVVKSEDVDATLRRFPHLAAFLAKDYVLVDEDSTHYMPELFRGNPLEITEAFIVETVTEYHDPEVRKLINGVVITR